jgi:hypothetical protein
MKWRWRIIGRPDAPTEPGGGARVDQGAPEPGMAKLRPLKWKVTFPDSIRSEDCRSPMPRSADSSVRWRASSWMRWSGLEAVSPALPRRKARRGLNDQDL